MISKKEAYRLLYKFLKEKGLLCDYCSCVQKSRGNTLRMKNWSAKKILQKVIGDYLILESKLVWCCARSESSFLWSTTQEGQEFWHNVLAKEWVCFLSKMGLCDEIIGD